MKNIGKPCAWFDGKMGSESIYFESAALYALWVIQSTDNGGLEISACLDMKNIGKPCTGKLHARFDEGGLSKDCSLLYLVVLLTRDAAILGLGLDGVVKG